MAMRLVKAGWCALVCGLVIGSQLIAGGAWAQVSFSAEGSSRLELLDPGEMGFSTAFGPTLSDVDRIGNADATSSGTQDSLPLRLSSSVVGFANPPGPGDGLFSSVNAVFLNGGLVTLVNDSLEDTRAATFSFSYSWDLSALATNSVTGFSEASVFISITGIDTETLLVDGVPAENFEFELRIDSDMGLPPIMGVEAVELTVIVGPESTAIFSMITDVRGFGIVVAPEPASILLIVLGVLTVGGIAHRSLSRR